ncbi:MAG: amino acid permease [Rhodothermia bacterium]|nr:MAG: amino acid permease [Rhodothermia bacterium]
MSQTQQPELRKALRLTDGIALVIGITIGSGIYSTPSIISGYFSSFSEIAVAWIGVAFFIVIGALIYSELGTRVPSTGGEYVYLTTCFGPFVGFMFGWSQLFIIRTSAAAGLSIVAADYVGYFFDLSPTAHMAVALSVIWGLGVFNYVGVQWASLFQKVTTLIKVVGLVALAAGGVFFLSSAANLLGTTLPTTTGLGPFGNLIAALMLIVFTHIGFDRVGYVAGEITNPREVIPKTMAIGTFIIIAIYWVMISTYHYALGMEGMRGTTTPAADVATILIGSVGAGAIAILAIVSAVGSINGTMMSSTRVYYAMAHDGLFFKTLDHVSETFRTPTRAIVAHCGWASVILIIRGSFETIAAGMVFAILIFYTLTTLAIFKLRRLKIGEDISWKMPLYPWLPIIYLVGVVGLLIVRIIFEFEKSLIDFAFVASGLPVSYFWLRKGKQSENDDATTT